MIPKINNGDELRNVRTNTINPLVDRINTFTESLVSVGTRCSDDYRMFPYTVTSPDATDAFITVALDADEYPVRSTYYKKGEDVSHPSLQISYDRSTGIMKADVGVVHDGRLFVEFWKVLG